MGLNGKLCLETTVLEARTITLSQEDLVVIVRNRRNKSIKQFYFLNVVYYG